jgi:L-histidine Nalpha-methyltransferase
VTVRVDVLLEPAELRAMLEHDVREGLARTPKSVRSRWVWDAYASELFDRIVALPSYDLPRREAEVLGARAGEIARLAGADTAVELGSGSSPRTGILLAALEAAGARRYVALDVSEAALRDALPGLATRYPALEVRGAVADFERQLARVEAPGRRLVAFLGSTVGALEREERAALYRTVAAFIGREGAFLVGLDLVRPLEQILAAYAHPDGLGRELTLNLLRILNRELGADFELERFDVVGGWNAEEERLEAAVRSLSDQVVQLPAIGLTVDLRAGETIRDQLSTKFRRDSVEAELSAAGLSVAGWWTDPEGGYALCLATGST